MFTRFKKKKTIEIIAPLNGQTIPIEEVPDPVFSEKMMGEGIAIVPASNTVLAPVNGTVKMIMPNSGHAIGIESEEGIEILIHVGMDTVALEGQGFEIITAMGAKVKVGEPLLSFDDIFLKEKGIDTLTMIVITNPNDHQIGKLYPNKNVIAAKDSILSYR